MKRTTIWLTEPQQKELARLAKKSGITVAELIRRILDEGIERRTK
jgi:predicted DNA-binding ribbon-helix-helix protein